MNHRAELAFAALIFLFFSVITLTVASRQMVPTGDEPHYLVTAHSLAVDGDLQLLNNYKNQDYRLFYPGGLAKRTTSNFDKSRELPAFGLGPAIFLTPFYWLAFTYFPSLLVPFLRLVVCSITSVALYQLLIVGSAVSARACTMLTVAAAALTSPLLTYCSQFYPEIFAFLLIVLALREFQSLEAHPLRSGVCHC